MNEMKVVVGVRSVLFERHNHEETDKSRAKVEAETKLALEAVSLCP